MSRRNFIKGNSGKPKDFPPKPRSRFSKFWIFKKLNHAQWISIVVVFLFLVLFQMFFERFFGTRGN
jgi:hypothetical protein